MTQAAIIGYRTIDPPYREDARVFDAIVISARRIADDSDATVDSRRRLVRRLAADAPNAHVRRILQACEKDIAAAPYRNWSELLAYCRFGAAPAGRYLAELHGEPETGAIALEALTTAQALVERVQRCRDDYTLRGRIYMPGDWLRQSGVAPEEMGVARASRSLRTVFGRVLNGVDLLLARARAHLSDIENRSLRRRSAVAASRVERLAAKLRRRDPMAELVTLGPMERTVASIYGYLRQ